MKAYRTLIAAGALFYLGGCQTATVQHKVDHQMVIAFYKDYDKCLADAFQKNRQFTTANHMLQSIEQDCTDVRKRLGNYIFGITGDNKVADQASFHMLNHGRTFITSVMIALLVPDNTSVN